MQLPDHLDSWISSGSEDVIYISMGSVFHLPDEVLHMFHQVIQALATPNLAMYQWFWFVSKTNVE